MLINPTSSRPNRPQTVLEALTDPSLVVADGKVARSNPSARAVLGSWIDGEDVRLVLRHPAALEKLLGRDEASGEIELSGLGSADRRWVMNVVTLEDGSKFVRLTDHSEAHAAERMRVDFVANASHELRTPLATLVGYAETLREQEQELDPSTRGRFTRIIHDEARRMQRLVEDLISLSRIEAERFTAPTQALELGPLAEEAVRNCRNSATERGCNITVKVAAELPPIAGDRAQILQLLDNLLSNAIRYGRMGGPICLSAGPDGDAVHIGVQDEGEGISPELIPRLTERFYRVDASRSRTQGGTGLGLSIVKHIVERHRGRLLIESRPGEGTTVHVHLPLADPQS
ncbi:MAG TPA: ATP-binding protein [Allosphingosinicella sp.]|nr:ATP-binding protein [Allosphingosinicella sp.]